MFDAVILSDLHLGSSKSQARQLCHLLEGIARGHLSTARVIMNGDVFDSMDFRRLNKTHWKVLSLLRKLSDAVEIVWLCGNHDGSAEIISPLLGVSVQDDYVLTSGGRRVLIFQGHIFDDFLDNHPILSWFGDCIYAFLQWIDKSYYLARAAKKGSKTFLRCAKKIEDRAIDLAARKECDAVCCGHTHHPIVNTLGPIHYFNSGSWTELPCTYLTVADGAIQLHQFQDNGIDGEIPVPPRNSRLEASLSAK